MFSTIAGGRSMKPFLVLGVDPLPTAIIMENSNIFFHQFV